jgi:hypothetical protein
MPIVRRSDCVPLRIVVCPVVAVVMLESRVASRVHCCSCCDAGESGGELCALCGECCHTLHTARHPTLQHHNSYNMTDNYRQWSAVGSPDDGHTDARNMLRYYWLPINHYLLYLLTQKIKLSTHYARNVTDNLFLTASLRRTLNCTSHYVVLFVDLIFYKINEI